MTVPARLQVLHQPGEVAESKVHDLRTTLRCKCEDVLRCFRHIRLLTHESRQVSWPQCVGGRSGDRLVVGVD
jgi:hypothetical protein